MLKKIKVVMLTTNQKATFGNLILTPTYPQKLLIFEHQRCTENSQHLYFISDEEIKEGDWFISQCVNKAFNNKPLQFLKIEEKLIDCIVVFDGKIEYTTTKKLFNNCKKIIATTSELRTIHRYDMISQPSQSFIEVFVKEYNKGNAIDEVMVEYDEHGVTCNNCYKVNGGINSPDCCGEYYIKDVIKINPKNNTITIKRMKDSWSREEVLDLVTRAYRTAWQEAWNHKEVNLDYWIEQNL